MALLIANARVVTLSGPRPRRGSSLGDLAVLACADVRIDGDRIVSVEPRDPAAPPPRLPASLTHLNAGGSVLMPAFVDAHTHACWPGGSSHRLDEWEMKRRGVPYLDILKSGGGIMATVRAVRASTQKQLAAALAEHLRLMLACGTTTVEVKSGYGLTTADELKMLRAISDARAEFPGTIVPTALLGHALDPDVPADRFVETTIRETLPAVHAEFPGIAIDAFCEQGAWSVEQTTRLFRAAKDLGHPIRVHADQFNSLGMTKAAIELGAISVDHLEAATPEDLKRLGDSPTFGVALPACGFHLDNRYANLRALVDGGGAPVIATNANPGSAPCFAMPFIVALACRACGLTPAESIAAATINPAALLGLTDCGVIATGMRADLLLLRHHDERALAFEFGTNPVEKVICGGRVI